MVIPGTTPSHVFDIGIDTSVISKAKITYKEDVEPFESAKIIVEKEGVDCVLQGNTITVNFTQEETFLFRESENGLVKVQIRVLTANNKVISHEPITVTVGECLDDEVLV